MFIYTGQIGALAVTGRAHYNVKLHFFKILWRARLTLHSEKFKMNWNGNSILSENICDLPNYQLVIFQ